jgi:hypothetical protein
MILTIMTAISIFLTILYYTFLVIDEIWKSPVGAAFKEWFEKTHALPKSEVKNSLLGLK